MNERLVLPSSNLLVGKTNTGKSHLLKCIMGRHADFFNYGVVFSPTSFNGSYDYIPPEFIYQEYDEQIVVNIINKQEEAIRKAQIDKKLKIPECFIIIDDGIGMVETHKTKNIFDRLYATGRHYHISTFLCVQSASYLSPAIRGNSTYVFITKIKSSSVRMMYDISSDFDSEEEFKEFLKRNSFNYRVIVFDDSDPYGQTLKIIRAPKTIPHYQLEY